MPQISIETLQPIAVLTINRPEKLNALNRSVIKELADALAMVEKDNSVRVVILTGEGLKAFVAGADISEFADFNSDQGEALSAEGQEKLFNRIEHFSKPVIAAVNGFALGGGLELAMACHIRIASSNARLGLPEVSLGVIPGYGGTQRLAQLVGRGRAMELICSAQMINADDAHRMGLVNHVVPQEDLLAEAHKLAHKIAANSPNAIKAAMHAVNTQYPTTSEGYLEEVKRFGSCFNHPDFKEGTTAFLEKRKPIFEGS